MTSFLGYMRKILFFFKIDVVKYAQRFIINRLFYIRKRNANGI